MQPQCAGINFISFVLLMQKTTEMYFSIIREANFLKFSVSYQDMVGSVRLLLEFLRSAL